MWRSMQLDSTEAYPGRLSGRSRLMAKIQETQTSFERCHNPQDVPESVCVLCLHTIVAPTMEVLEQLEHQHVCLEKQEPARR